jgi:transposase
MEMKHMVSEPGTEGIPVALRAPSIPSVGTATATRRTLQAVTDPEVPEKASRRKFTADYKLRILKEAETCHDPRQRGALLRREGLYSSHLTTWRRQAERGTLQVLSARRRGPKPQKGNPLLKRVSTLEKENQQLRHKLKQAETIIEVQKKISEILHGSPDPQDGNKS